MNKEILEKAEYCLNCNTKPCQKGCPLENDIPSFIKYVKEQKYEEAYHILSKTTVLQPICGLICPHTTQCEGNCIKRYKGKPTSIGEIEAYVGRLALENGYEYDEEKYSKNKYKIAIVGGGPSGLTCAAFLARKGYNVTIYEKYDKLGGILSHGIPEFRLDSLILDKTIQKIINLGIEVKYNKKLGIHFTLEQLKEKYDAIYLAIGSNVPMKMHVDGENLKGVYGANQLLENNIHPDYKNKKVAVVGGGNVAIDASRTIKKLGAKDVFIIYRRSEEEMPAEKKEIEDAKKDGIKFLFKTNILKIIESKDLKKVKSIECIKTELIQKENELRLSPINVEGSNYEMDVDYVVMAIGSIPDKELINKLNLEYTEKGYIKVDKNYMTSEHGIFAGGDIIGTKETLAWAARAGKLAADAIRNYVEKR